MKIFSKELVVSLLTVTVSGFMGITNANAQEFTVQGDLVSSYVWRGMYQTGASFQPTLAFSVGGLTVRWPIYKFLRITAIIERLP